MKKYTLYELSQIKDWEKAVVVIDNKSFKQDYPLESRSYVVYSNAKYFNNEMGGTSLFGTSLDESDVNIRLDWYIYDGWIVEYCYILE